MNIFQPILVLSPSADNKQYDAKASMWVPDGCHVANGTDPSFPKGMIGIPEVQPLQLLVEKNEGNCNQALTNIHFEANGLSCDGKYNLVAFSVLDGTIMGTDSSILPCLTFSDAELSELETCESGASVQHVVASANIMPGWDPEMWVGIHVMAPMGGYEYEITDLGGFGFTGRTLLLDLVATAPESGITVISPQTLLFNKKTARPFPYDSVAVRFEEKIHLANINFVH